MKAFFFEPVTESAINKPGKIFGPEYNGMDIIRCGVNNGLFLIKGINGFKKTFINPLHKPVHIKCGNVGAPGSGYDNFRRHWRVC